MTPDNDELVLLREAMNNVEATLNKISEQVDAVLEQGQQNIRYSQHLQGDFKKAMTETADKAEVLAYESSRLFEQSQSKNLRLTEIMAQLVGRMDPLCDNLDALTAQIRGLTDLSVTV